ncbi:MAG: EamA family transporter, partial [Desulfobacteraceae bacterium]|nr:EamA family transporter [Desulfobacteraceae bacterium]
ILTFQDMGAFGLSLGSIFIILACVCWGFENNCTRKLSSKDPLQIVVIKGLGSGTGVFLIAVFFNSVVFFPAHILYALFLGFFAYGLSIYFYVKAQRHLGAARTGSYFALAPFIGVILSFLLLREPLTPAFFAALVIMIAGTWLVLSESHSHRHIHQMVQHDHRHNHSDGHHGHTHDKEVKTDHSHFHNHKPMAHDHDHTPDLHHRHQD